MNKTELSFNDKLEIFDIKNITDWYIIGNNRKIIIFEYLSIFKKSVMFDMIREKNLDFQLKIKKEKFLEVKEEIFSNEYLDLSIFTQKKQNEFSIMINDEYRDSIPGKKIDNKEILGYIKEEKWELYIYRHYLIINIANSKEDFEALIYDILYQISETNIIIRRLDNNDLENYLFNEINYPFNKKGWNLIPQYSENEKQQKKEDDTNFLLNILDPGIYATYITKILGKFINIIDNAYFQGKVSNIGGFILDLFEQKMFKWDNYIQIGANFKWWLLITKWYPTDNFNILNNFFFYLHAGDSVTINIYWSERHKMEEKRDIKGIEKLMLEKKPLEINDQISYIQTLVNFNDINPVNLDNRIEIFLLNIWTDFYGQRIVNSMSRYISTAIWTGVNNLHTERGYDTTRLRNNLIF